MKKIPRSIDGLGRSPHRAWVLLCLVVVISLPGCERPTANSAPAEGSKRDLLIAYDILSDTLSDESKLGALLLLKRVTFNRPVPELEDLMKRISGGRATSGFRLCARNRLGFI